MTTVVVGEHLNYFWTENDVEAITKLVKDGLNLNQLQELLDRDVIEILVLLDTLANSNAIPSVNNNIFGPPKAGVKDGD